MEKLEKISIWKKINNFIKKIFDRNENLLIDMSREEENNTKEPSTKRNLNQYEVMNLQKSYENGTIKEDELTELEKRSLKELYKKQIEILGINILNKEQELQNYKEKILKVKQKISLNVNE